MILETKYNLGDKVWFMSYRAKKIISAMITAIEVNVKDKTYIRYQIFSHGKPSYFFEFQLFGDNQEAIDSCFNTNVTDQIIAPRP